MHTHLLYRLFLHYTRPCHCHSFSLLSLFTCTFNVQRVCFFVILRRCTSTSRPEFSKNTTNAAGTVTIRRHHRRHCRRRHNILLVNQHVGLKTVFITPFHNLIAHTNVSCWCLCVPYLLHIYTRRVQLFTVGLSGNLCMSSACAWLVVVAVPVLLLLLSYFVSFFVVVVVIL